MRSFGGSAPHAPGELHALDRITFDVRGLTSEADARRLSLRLRRLEGVLAARVRFPEEVATVTLVTGKTTVRDLLWTMQSCGYDAAARAEPKTTAARQRDAVHRRLGRKALWTTVPAAFVVAIAGLMRMGYLGGEDAYAVSVGPLLFATGAVLFVGRSLFLDTHRRIGWQRAAREVPLALAGLAAALGSLIAFFSDSDPMCEVAAAIVAAYHLGGWLESWLHRRAERHLRQLTSLQPWWATVRREGRDFRIRIHDLVGEDHVVVAAGEVVPVDGTVAKGQTNVDESAVFGPGSGGARQPGDRVWAGTRNGEGDLLVQPEITGNATVLGRLLRVLEDARETRAPVQRRGDRLAAWLAPIALLLSIGTFAVWRWLDPGASFWHGLLPALAVLVVTSPWALGSASAVPVLAAMSRAARLGVIFRDAAVLEHIRRLEVLVFEKAGEMTTGTPTLDDFETHGGADPRDALRMLMAVEQASSHGVAKACFAYAIGRFGGEIATGLATPTGFRTIPGDGVIARVEGKEVVVGRSALLEAKGVECGKDSQAAGSGHWLYLAIDGSLRAKAHVVEQLQPDARSTVAYLKSRAVLPMMVSASTREEACAVAAHTGIACEDVRADIDTAGHAEVVRTLKAAGYRVGLVGTAGTDQPSLEAADVGLATVPSGVLPAERHPVLLLRPGTGGVVTAFETARHAFRRMRQNLGLSVLVMLAAIPAALGFVPPQGAVLALLASVLVTGLNGLRSPRTPNAPAPRSDGATEKER